MSINVNGVRSKDVAGVRRRNIGNYVGPNPYVSATGDLITAASLGLAVIEEFDLAGIVGDPNGVNIRVVTVTFATDGSSITVRWFTDLVTQVVNGVDLSAYTSRFEAVGR